MNRHNIVMYAKPISIIIAAVTLLIGGPPTIPGPLKYTAYELQAQLSKQEYMQKKIIYTNVSQSDIPVSINPPNQLSGGASYQYMFQLRKMGLTLSQRQINEKYIHAITKGSLHLIAMLTSGGEQDILTVPIGKEGEVMQERGSFSLPVALQYDALIFRYDAPIGSIEIQYWNIVKQSKNEDKSLQTTLGYVSDLHSISKDLGDIKLPGNYVFSNTNRLVGSLFTATTPTLSAIDLRLGIVGSGGYGKYRIELRELFDEDNGTLENSRVLSGLEFYSFESYKYQPQDGFYPDIWRFPLAAILKPGKKYIISLNALDAVLGSRDTLKVGLTNVDLSTMAIALYSADYATHADGSRVLSGETVTTFANDQWEYDYISPNKPTDLLDLDISNMQKIDSAKEIYFYDTVKDAIIGQIYDQARLQYDFNFPGTPSKIIVNVLRPSSDYYPIKLEYQFEEGVVWSPCLPTLLENREIDQGLEISCNLKNNDIQGKNLKIRIVPEAGDGRMQIPDFGIKNLRVVAVS